MTNQPLVSVLIPVYIQNDTQLIHLKESIDSVLAQVYQHFEIILINDGCIEAAKIVVDDYSQNFPQIRVHHNKQNEGIVVSLNMGIELARGELIARHDADDICLPERFEKQVAYLLQHEQCGALFTGSVDIDIDSNHRDYFPVSENPQKIRAELLFNSRLRHPSLMVRKEALVNIDGYQNYYLAEDYDLFCRLSSRGEIHGMNESLLLYRRYDTKNHEKRSLQLESAAQISYQYISRLLKEYSLADVDKESFIRFWFHIQSRGKSRCSILDLKRIESLWRLLILLTFAWEVWHKEIRNCIKHGYHEKSKIQGALMYLYLKFRLSI
jgi:glycosyltransferase involved in cell wall biosynthesis